MSYEKTDTCSIPALTIQKRPLRSLGSRGYTLVELLFVCIILGVLAILAIPTYGSIREKMRISRCVVEIRGLEKAIAAYMIDSGGALPDNIGQLGLSANTDPWGHAYEYNKVPYRKYLSFINQDFDIYSLGADGVPAEQFIDTPASKDDVVRAGEGGYVGLASDLTGE